MRLSGLIIHPARSKPGLGGGGGGGGGARERFPVQVFMVNCLVNEVETTKTADKELSKRGKVIQMTSIFFCQRIDIGFLPEAILFQKSDKNFADLTLDEISNHKQFKFNGVQLQLSYVPVNTSGVFNKSSEVVEPPKTYNVITGKTCSLCGDRGNLVSPNQHNLEIYVEDQQHKKKRREKDIGFSYHAGTVTFESANEKMFSILLDGEFYGPFHKVTVSFKNKTSNVEIDLMTFNKIFTY
jgi:hypothetical protein